ncbi:DUF1294 domain-containing protein [Pseudomonas sp. nanlin1]|uniref:DUF1294 domain-containing protein n=1 Tax=Pseudomonas sp. nanlin1 TaxID=3040605 RepID=UPI00388D8843
MSKAKPSSADARPGQARYLKLKLVAFALLCLLPGWGCVQLALFASAPAPLLIYLVASAVAFALYGSDKRRARQARQRTPEKVLHGLELCGGWPGALLAQQMLRHKTRKVSFQVTFWLIVAVHQAFWFDHLVLNGRYFSGSAF